MSAKNRVKIVRQVKGGGANKGHKRLKKAKKRQTSFMSVPLTYFDFL